MKAPALLCREPRVAPLGGVSPRCLSETRRGGAASDGGLPAAPHRRRGRAPGVLPPARPGPAPRGGAPGPLTVGLCRQRGSHGLNRLLLSAALKMGAFSPVAGLPHVFGAGHSRGQTVAGLTRL